MNAYKTCLLLTLGSLLAACGHTPLPVQGQAPSVLRALEECHGCGVLPSTNTDQFWVWEESSFEPYADLDSHLASELGRPSPVVTLARLGQGTVVEERSGLMKLRSDGAQAALPSALPLACMGPDPVVRPDDLLPEDGNWSGRLVIFTLPVDPAALETRDEGNRFCSTTFGAGWQVFAENRNTSQWATGTTVRQNLPLSVK